MRQREEIELLRWRISFVGYVIASALLVLLFGFWNAQIVQSGYYQLRAEQNRIREIPLPAPRGRIYDRYHRVLADNRELLPSKFTGHPDYLCGSRGGCWLTGATIQLQFAPDLFASDSAVVRVAPPEGPEIFVDFDLASLR